MKGRLTSVAVLFALLLPAAGLQAQSFSALYAFGDSLSDAGNSPSAVMSIYKLLGNQCDPSHPCLPYFDGRFSNGPVAVEGLAHSLFPGGSTQTNFADFAVGGATTGIGNKGDGGTSGSAGAFGLPGMSQELELYAMLSGGKTDPNALYFLWGGANDFLTGDSPTAAAHNIAGYVDALLAAGAEHIFVPNLPDLSLTPSARDAGVRGQAHAFSLLFNNELATQLDNLDSLFPAAQIIQFDTFSFFNDVVSNPAGFGFSNSRDACLSSILVEPCKNPGSYVFWDDFHPTTQGHTVIADAFAQTVPIPSAVWLFGSALAGLIGIRGRTISRTMMRSFT